MLEELKEEVCNANKKLKELGLVDLTWGNVSAIDREKNCIVIKPSGIPYEKLHPNTMVVVDIKGKVKEGRHKPSTDTMTHLVLYDSFPQISSIVHTHSFFATVWAQACMGIPIMGATHAEYFGGNIPLVEVIHEEEINEEYHKNIGKAIVKKFIINKIDPLKIRAALVAFHGPFVWGTTPEETVETSYVLEICAKMAYYTYIIRKGNIGIPEYMVKKHFKMTKNTFSKKEEI